MSQPPDPAPPPDVDYYAATHVCHADLVAIDRLVKEVALARANLAASEARLLAAQAQIHAAYGLGRLGGGGGFDAADGSILRPPPRGGPMVARPIPEEVAKKLAALDSATSHPKADS